MVRALQSPGKRGAGSVQGRVVVERTGVEQVVGGAGWGQRARPVHCPAHGAVRCGEGKGRRRRPTSLRRAAQAQRVWAQQRRPVVPRPRVARFRLCLVMQRSAGALAGSGAGVAVRTSRSNDRGRGSDWAGRARGGCFCTPPSPPRRTLILAQCPECGNKRLPSACECATRGGAAPPLCPRPTPSPRSAHTGARHPPRVVNSSHPQCDPRPEPTRRPRSILGSPRREGRGSYRPRFVCTGGRMRDFPPPLRCEPRPRAGSGAAEARKRCLWGCSHKTRSASAGARRPWGGPAGAQSARGRGVGKGHSGWDCANQGV